MTHVRIESFEPRDAAAIETFVAAIQEHERLTVTGLKPGAEIAQSYASLLLRNVAERNGVILMARAADRTVGFVCAWIDHDDDPLVCEDARQHAYISDIFVIENRRRTGVARSLLQAVEQAMQRRGCRRVRICSKATHVEALACYETAGFRPYGIVLSKPIEADSSEA